MDDEEYNVIEEDPQLLAHAFSTGLQQNGAQFFSELLEMAMNDYELENQQKLIKRAFEMIKKFIQRKGSTYIDLFQLSDLSDYDLDVDTVNRIGYLAYQMNYRSPEVTSSTLRLQERRLNQSKSPSEVPDEEDDYGDDNFEEDSEEIDEENIGEGKSVEIIRNNFMIPTPVVSTSKSTIQQSNQSYQQHNKSTSHQPISPIQIPARPTVSTSINMNSVNAATNNKRTKSTSWITHKQWKLGEKIGSGSFGDVYMGLNDNVLHVDSRFVLLSSQYMHRISADY